MNLLEMLHLDELSHGLANLSMFPFFDMAHYIMSVMALREQPGKFEDRFSQAAGRAFQRFSSMNHITFSLFGATLTSNLCHASITL